MTPSKELLALKHQQTAAKIVPNSGESRLLRKARKQKNNSNRGKPLCCEGVAKHLSTDVSVISSLSVMRAASER